MLARYRATLHPERKAKLRNKDRLQNVLANSLVFYFWGSSYLLKTSMLVPFYDGKKLMQPFYVS
jgi:hypothetical protein